MSRTLDLPDLTGSEKMGVNTGWEDDASILRENETREFVNNSLTNIQTFFSRMIQLDPQEDELFGQTGRDVNGFRLTTEDEPDGVDHDTAISIRSDHIANLSIQSGKASTSDALLTMGTWDSTLGIWGRSGALRVDMSDSNAFIMESNYGDISFDNNTTTRRLTANVYNLKVGGGAARYAEFQGLDDSAGGAEPALFFYNGGDPPTPSNGAIVYAKSGDLFRMKSDASVDEWGAGGSGGSGFDPASTQTITGDWTFNDATFQPASEGPPFALGTNADDSANNLVTHLNADYLDGNHASVFPQDASGVGTTIVGNWTFTPGGGGDFPLMPSNTKFNQSTGTAPFQVSSTTVVANLKSETSNLAANSTLFNSQADTVFAKLAGNETVTGDYTFSGDSTFSGEVDFSITTADKVTIKSGALKIGAKAAAEAPFSLTAPYSATVVTGLNADLVDGIEGTALAEIAQAETISATWTFSTPPAFTEPNTGFEGTAPFSAVSKGLVANLNAEFLDGRAGSTIPDTTAATDITGVWSFVKIEAGTGDTIGIGTDATDPKDIQLHFASGNTDYSGGSADFITLDTITIPKDGDNTTGTSYVECYITGVNDNDTSVGLYQGQGVSFVVQTLFKNNAGTVTELGTATETRRDDSNTGACDAEIAISGETILIKVKGLAGGTSHTYPDFKWTSVTKIYNAIP